MSDTKLTKWDLILPAIVFIVGIPLMILFYNYDNNKIENNIKKSLYLPDSVKTEVKGFVLKERYIKEKGITLIDLSNGRKYSLRDAWFIKRDYYIYKPANNDSIYIYDRKNKLINHKQEN
ncbi:hypothetical protein [Dysgonomonas sp. BGC7]|uniref:hypothetical protein n=1 Tax=Dysgonomonas sp. BGC7 TaxID=1658008 RepID=UPI000682FDD9|nr:hypothetical protein [Dysgonomonas sp. BGC7]MBD8388929.1 hypothetical protein [Dysgonomonas sp. BGC7]